MKSKKHQLFLTYETKNQSKITFQGFMCMRLLVHIIVILIRNGNTYPTLPHSEPLMQKPGAPYLEESPWFGLIWTPFWTISQHSEAFKIKRLMGASKSTHGLFSQCMSLEIIAQNVTFYQSINDLLRICWSFTPQFFYISIYLT